MTKVEIIAKMALNRELSANLGVTNAIENYVKALCKGLLKIMSKSGISTLRSYRNAQVFEAVGLNSDVKKRLLSAGWPACDQCSIAMNSGSNTAVSLLA